MKVLWLFSIALVFIHHDIILASERGWNNREFMPSILAFAPLIGNPQEARMAVRKLVEGPDLHVEIGNTLDLIRWTHIPGNPNEHQRSVSIGVSFFSYGYITSVDQSRLKVDAIDGFFGGHVVYSTVLYNHPWQLRLRLMHQSAHMVDGRYDKYNESWVGDRLPISYTRDQAEITTLHRFGNIRFGGGAGVVWLRRPEEVSPYHIFLSADKLLYSSTEKSTHWYGGYFLRGENNNSFALSHSVEAGVKFGAWEGRGIRVTLQYYNGLNFFGEYFDERLVFAALGFSFDFW